MLPFRYLGLFRVKFSQSSLTAQVRKLSTTLHHNSKNKDPIEGEKLDEKSNKTKKTETIDRLNLLLKTMVEETETSTSTKAINAEMARPKQREMKRKSAAKETKEPEETEALVHAAKQVAESFGGDVKQTETQLLSKLSFQSTEEKNDSSSSSSSSSDSSSSDEESSEPKKEVPPVTPKQFKPTKSTLNLSELIIGMKIDRSKKPAAEGRASQVRKVLGSQQRGEDLPWRERTPYDRRDERGRHVQGQRAGDGGSDDQSSYSAILRQEGRRDDRGRYTDGRREDDRRDGGGRYMEGHRQDDRRDGGGRYMEGRRQDDRRDGGGRYVDGRREDGKSDDQSSYSEILRQESRRDDKGRYMEGRRQGDRRKDMGDGRPPMPAEKVKLFGNEALGIFVLKKSDGSSDEVAAKADHLTMWRTLQERELRLAVTHPPSNHFEEMILWTEQGKLWKFPIDNEQGLDEERKVYFADHVFLEQHLEPWCPRKGPVRHFMELVCVGMSKNPYLTAREKRDHIDWFREYFQQKQDILKETGALGDGGSERLSISSA